MSRSKTERAVPGTCLCGAIKYEIDLPTPDSVRCPQWEGAGELETPQG